MKQLPPYNQKITLDDEIKELERELATRQRVYPEWTSGLNPKLTPELASKRIAILQKIKIKLLGGVIKPNKKNE